MESDKIQKVQLVSVVSDWTLESLKKHLDDKIEAMEKLQISKWEGQEKHNLAANEWRGTIGDLKRDFVPRTEHEALVQRFVAEQLSVAKMLANSVGERSGIGISWGAIVGAVGILAGLFAAIQFMGSMRNLPVTATVPPVTINMPATPTPQQAPK